MKKREQIAPEDLAGALQDRVGPTSGRLLGASPIRRVKVGEAWTVRLWDGTWLDADSPFAGHVKVSHTRAWRRMFDSQYNAKAALRRVRKDGLECPSARVVRVTFYEVRRG